MQGAKSLRKPQHSMSVLQIHGGGFCAGDGEGGEGNGIAHHVSLPAADAGERIGGGASCGGIHRQGHPLRTATMLHRGLLRNLLKSRSVQDLSVIKLSCYMLHELVCISTSIPRLVSARRMLIAGN